MPHSGLRSVVPSVPRRRLPCKRLDRYDHDENIVDARAPSYPRARHRRRRDPRHRRPVRAAATPEETKAFVEKAVAYIKQVGPEKAYADFSRPDGGFVQGELYMFCYAFDGMNIAHGGNPSFVGKNLISVKDPDGFQVNAEIIKLRQSKGEGWIDFKWPNPLSKKIEAKSAWIVKVTDAVCGSGYYKVVRGKAHLPRRAVITRRVPGRWGRRARSESGQRYA
jgi:cytochrome c